MAEQLEDRQEGAPPEGDEAPETPPEESVQSEAPAPIGLTKADIDAFRTEQREVLNAHYRGLQGLVQQLETRTGERILELVGETKRNATLIKGLAEGTLTSEQFEEITGKVEAAQVEDEAKTAKERNKVLEAEVQRLSKAAETDLWQSELFPHGRRTAKKNGLDLAAIWPDIREEMPTRLGPATPEDPRGVEWFKDKMDEVIENYATRKAKREEPRPRTDSTRPAGGTGALNPARYKEILEKGLPLPSPEEIDRMTAATYLRSQ